MRGRNRLWRSEFLYRKPGTHSGRRVREPLSADYFSVHASKPSFGLPVCQPILLLS
jgi:hypothetical protein